MTAQLKVKEARFFIELLHALEVRGESLCNGSSASEEASYLFSAIVNAFYSTVVMLEDAGVAAAAFRKEHAEIYAHGKHGGVRAITVHKQHVPIALSGYIPPLGNEVVLTFRKDPKLKPTPKPKPKPKPAITDLAFRSQHYVCLPRDWSIVHALEFCEEHVEILDAFVKANDVGPAPVVTATDGSSPVEPAV